MTTTGFEYTSSLGGGLVCKDCNKRDDPLGLQLLKDIRGHHSLGHSASSNRGDDVAEDVVLETLLCKCLSKANEGQFGSCYM